MALFSQDALKEGVATREVWAWAAFDFANSGYTTVVPVSYTHLTLPTNSLV